MSTLMVGVGDYKVSKTPGDEIKTMALGSCVGVIALCKKSHAIGLLHVALPDSSINKGRQLDRPAAYADTGIPLLLKGMEELGADKKSLIIKLAGGAQIMDPNNTFNIGKRNLLAVRKILWSHRLGAVSEDVGGQISRTVTVEVDTGKVSLSSPGRGVWGL